MPGFNSTSWDSSAGIVTLKYDTASSARAVLKAGTSFFVKHYVNMQAWGVYGWMVQGSYTLDGVTLLTSAGMGLRCDYCKGKVLIKVNFNVLTNDAVFFKYIY